MVVEKKLYTVAEFEAFIAQPENRDRLFELIDGEIVEKMPTEEHSVIQAEFTRILANFVKPNKLGRVAVEARHRPQDDAHNDRIPDISFTSSQRALPLVKQGAVPQMPDLAIEIQSPDDKLKDLRAKAAYYLANGARMVWLFLPKKRLIEVHTADDVQILTETDTLDGSDVLPAFTLPVRSVFEVD